MIRARYTCPARAYVRIEDAETVSIIPCDQENRHYRALVDSGLHIEDALGEPGQTEGLSE